MSNYYAQIDGDSIVVAVTEAAGEINAPHMIPIESLDDSLLRKKYEGGQFVDVPPPPAPEPEWAWYMDLGPFADRLGAASVVIDLSTEPGVVVIRNDFSRRKWIDLKDPRVIAALWYLAGQAHPVLGTLSTPLLTPAAVTTILTTPVPLKDNLALRKLYFS